MSGWTKIKNGDVELIHHSTSSTIELRVLEDKELGIWQSLWLDYYVFDDIKKCIQQIENQ